MEKKIVLWSNEPSLQSNDEPRAPSAQLFFLPLIRFRLEARKVFCTPQGFLKSATSQNNTSEDKNSLTMLPLHEQGFSASFVLVQSWVSGWGCWDGFTSKDGIYHTCLALHAALMA